MEVKKTINFFWANKEISWMRYMTLYSFRKLNPDWEMVLFLSEPNEVISKTWTDSPMQDFHNFSGQDKFGSIKDLDIDIRAWEFEDKGEVISNIIGASHKSNFFKWQLMANEGGFYSDLDILYIKPFDSFYQKCKNFDIVICFHHGYFSIGLLGSSGNNEFFDDIYKHTFKSYNSGCYQSAGVLSIYSFCKKIANDIKLTWGNSFKVVRGHYKDASFYNISMELIYPWTYNKMGDVFEKEHTTIPDECIGIHWYAGDRISQKYNNLLNEDNFQNYKNTYCYFVNRVMEL